jgi:hypothetical protein
MRNLVIGGVVGVVVAAGVALAIGGGDDKAEVSTEEVSSTTLVDDGSDESDGSGTGSSGGGSGSQQGGGSSQGGGSQEGGGSAQGGGAPQADDDGDDDADPAPPQEQSTAPTVNLVNQRCSGGKLIASVTANASSGYRKGVQSVTMTRQNEFNAYLQPANATWLGPETGAGDQWDGTVVFQQNFKKTLRVVATSDSGQSTTKDFAITVPC